MYFDNDSFAKELLLEKIRAEPPEDDDLPYYEYPYQLNYSIQQEDDD